MNPLLTIVWILIGGAVGWRIAMARAAAAASQAREEMGHEIRHWAEQAERMKVKADQLAQEKEAWAAGCKQGRDDVISIVPLMLAAQHGLMSPDQDPDTREINNCA